MTEIEYKNKLRNQLISYRDTLNLSEDVTFGIEIEYENILKDKVSFLLGNEQLFRNLIGWKNKREIDIEEINKLGEEYNGEIVSPVLNDNIQTWKDLKIVLEMLSNNEGIITEKCGGHVNIGAHLLSNQKAYKNFILLWLLYEKEIYKFCSGEYKYLRPDNDAMFRKISLQIDLKELLSNTKRFLRNIQSIPFHKFHDIYVHKPILDKKVFGNIIEFRLPNGSLNEEIWQNYINFFAKFILCCKKELDEEKLLFKIKYQDSNAVELADLVFDNEIDKENFLIQTLKTNKVYKKEMPKHKIYY